MIQNSNFLDRVRPFVPDDRPASLADIRKMHAQDPDAFFGLAVNGIGDSAPIGVKGLEWLARTLSVLMRDGFSIATGAQQYFARGNRGGFLALDGGQDEVQFIQDLRTGSAYDHKLHGQSRSKECLDFFLEEFPWDEEVRTSMLLRLSPDDASAILGGSPRYQRDGLLDCAREIVRAPAAVYKGLRHDGPMHHDGWAFCGIPTRRRMNDGTYQDPPPGFTFVVFADPQFNIFDWDWVPAKKDDPLIPRDVDERFDQDPMPNVHAEILLGNVSLRQKSIPFQPARAWFSAKGDCVFWYIDEAESYAAREDEYLTAYYKFGNKELNCVGFKLKMVSKLFDAIDRYRNNAAEGILIDFSADPVRINLVFLMDAWWKAGLPRSKGLFDGMRLIERLGTAFNVLKDTPPTLDIPRSAMSELQEA